MLKIFVIIFVLSFLALNTAGASESTPNPLSFDVVSTTDLTKAFNTRTAWSLIITEDTAHHDEDGGYGNLYFCFMHKGTPYCPHVVVHDCTVTNIRQVCPGDSGGDDDMPYNIFKGVFVFHDKNRSTLPILVVKAGGNFGGSGTPTGPLIWAYRHKTDTFELIFAATGSDGDNTEARFVRDGLLAGDVIISTNDPTGHWPWPYGIEVYKLLPPGRYVNILNFIGKSAQVGGPSGPVIDADIPEILRRLQHMSK